MAKPTNPASRCECRIETDFRPAGAHREFMTTQNRIVRCPHCLERDEIGEQFVKLVGELHEYWLDHSAIPPSRFRPLLSLLERAARAGMGVK